MGSEAVRFAGMSHRGCVDTPRKAPTEARLACDYIVARCGWQRGFVERVLAVGWRKGWHGGRRALR